MVHEDGTVERQQILEESGRIGRAAKERVFSEPFVFLFLARLPEIARDRALDGTDLRVFLAVLARATQETPSFDSDPAGIATDLDIHVRQVGKSLAKLAGRGLLLRPKRGKLALAPDVAWRGTAQARAQLLVARRTRVVE